MASIDVVGNNYSQGTVGGTEKNRDVTREDLVADMAVYTKTVIDLSYKVSSQEVLCMTAKQRYDEAVLKMHAGFGGADIVAKLKGEMDVENAKWQALKDQRDQANQGAARVLNEINSLGAGTQGGGSSGSGPSGPGGSSGPSGPQGSGVWPTNGVSGVTVPAKIKEDLEAYMLYVVNGMQKISEDRARTMLDDQKARNDKVTRLNELISKLATAGTTGDADVMKLYDPEATEINNLLGPDTNGNYPLAKTWVVAWKIDGEWQYEAKTKEDYDKWMAREGEIDWQGKDSTSHKVSCADFGGNGTAEFRFNKDQIDKMKEQLRAKVDSLTSTNQLVSVEMQSAITMSNQLKDMESNIQASFKKTDDNIIGNIQR